MPHSYTWEHHWFSFFQRIKDGSTIDSVKTICVGDHIECINGENIVGWRHYEVAKKLKELKKEELFTLQLIEPKKAFGKLSVCVWCGGGGMCLHHIILSTVLVKNTEDTDSIS